MTRRRLLLALGLALAVPIVLVVLIFLGCQPAKGEARKQFLSIVRNGSHDQKEMYRVLVAAFPVGSPESDYEDLLKTAKRVTDREKMAWYSRDFPENADTMYVWDIDDNSDGAAYCVFTGGSPRTILGVRMPVFDN